MQESISRFKTVLLNLEGSYHKSKSMEWNDDELELKS